MKANLDEVQIPVVEQIANVAAMLPLADKFKLRLRVLKLGAFCDHWLDWLGKDVGLKRPMDKVALVTLFIVGSYIPTLVLSMIWSALFNQKS